VRDSKHQLTNDHLPFFHLVVALGGHRTTKLKFGTQNVMYFRLSKRFMVSIKKVAEAIERKKKSKS
jgi:hypothetical protein